MYTVFRIPKRSGGFRVIEAPNDKLKLKQKRALRALQKVLKVSPFAHGFQPYKNIATMAAAHVGKEWVGSIDIKDFFPSIKLDAPPCHRYKTKKDITDNALTKLLAVAMHDFSDGKGARLPQGAPTSPFLSNAYLYDFDWKVAWRCAVLNCAYTRYADDITISGEDKKKVYALLKYAEALMAPLGLEVNRRKTKMMHKKKRQMVCGVVVNEKLNLPRRWRKNLRAEIFQQKMKGGRLRSETKGRIAFKGMVLGNKKESNSSIQIINSILLASRMEGR